MSLTVMINHVTDKIQFGADWICNEVEIFEWNLCYLSNYFLN